MNELFGALKPLGLLEAVAGDAASRDAGRTGGAASACRNRPCIAGSPRSRRQACCSERSTAGDLNSLPRASRLAFSILGNRPGGTLRHEILQRVVQEVGEACNLTVLDGTQVSYLDRVEAEWLLRISFQQGSKVPAYCSASGKLFLALMRPAKRDLLLRLMPLERLTDNTITEQSRIAQRTRRDSSRQIRARPGRIPVRPGLSRRSGVSAKGAVA